MPQVCGTESTLTFVPIAFAYRLPILSSRPPTQLSRILLQQTGGAHQPVLAAGRGLTLSGRTPQAPFNGALKLSPFRALMMPTP